MNLWIVGVLAGIRIEDLANIQQFYRSEVLTAVTMKSVM
jgi:hypothetical protein